MFGVRFIRLYTLFLSISPFTPKLNRAKSYFIGSFGQNWRKFAVSSSTAAQSFWRRVSKPSWRLTLPTWTSSGMQSTDCGILFQIPKSTPVLLCRTIQRKYIFIRLAAEPFSGLAKCFSVRCSCSTLKKILYKCDRVPLIVFVDLNPSVTTFSSPP